MPVIMKKLVPLLVLLLQVVSSVLQRGDNGLEFDQLLKSIEDPECRRLMEEPSFDFQDEDKVAKLPHSCISSLAVAVQNMYPEEFARENGERGDSPYTDDDANFMSQFSDECVREIAKHKAAGGSPEGLSELCGKELTAAAEKTVEEETKNNKNKKEKMERRRKKKKKKLEYDFVDDL